MRNATVIRYFTATLPLAAMVGVSAVIRLAAEALAFARVGSDAVAAFACALPLMFVSSGVLYGLSLSALSLAKSGRLTARGFLLASILVSSVLAALGLVASPVIVALLGVEGEILRQAKLLLFAYSLMLLPMGCSVVLGALLKHHGFVRTADSITLGANIAFVVILVVLSAIFSGVSADYQLIVIAASGLLVALGALGAHLLVISAKALSPGHSPDIAGAAIELAKRSAPLASSNLLAGAYVVAVGHLISQAGGANAVAALGLILRAEQIVLVGVSVVTMTAMPLLSSQWHVLAGRRDAFKSAAVLSAAWGALSGIVLLACAILLPDLRVALSVAPFYVAIAPVVFVALGLHATSSAVWAIADRRQLQVSFTLFRLFAIGLIPLAIACELFGVSVALAWLGAASVLSAPFAVRLALAEMDKE
jgi:Na+-driven multidrug efflux pump